MFYEEENEFNMFVRSECKFIHKKTPQGTFKY